MEGGMCEFGIVGLGVMGRNLALNMADHGILVAGYDKDFEKVRLLENAVTTHTARGVDGLPKLFSSLRRPRAVMMLVPAGSPVDAVIHDLLQLLSPDDVLVDAGNSYFKDTDRRAQALSTQGIHYLGVGISGGEQGARHGPSIMPGGSHDAYERVRPVFEAVAAKVGGEPCVAWLGPGSAGHYVKMVHNGIEYGLMHLIAETSDLMRRGLGFTDDELAAVYENWNRGQLSGYLVEITSHIFRKEDPRTGKRLIDVILDEARQKGTGMWTSEDAMALQVPVPTIDVAVTMRDLSAYKEEREAASRVLDRPVKRFQGGREPLLSQLHNALHVAMVLAYAQGMAQLRRASRTYGYDLDLRQVARIWRGGCIIRAALLEDIRAAFQAKPDLPNLLLDPRLAQVVMARQEDLRGVVEMAATTGIPAPGLMASLGYFDSYRSAWLPANLIEAQRDYFGAHTYERIDAEGTFHTEWVQTQGGQEAELATSGGE